METKILKANIRNIGPVNSESIEKEYLDDLKKNIMEQFQEHPELFDSVIMELRKQKINKIRKNRK